MSLDISRILGKWPYKPGQVTARKIMGRDGKEKIQLRLDLGLLQMETSGRPDGQRPHGHESLLAFQEHRLRRHRDEHDGSDEGGEFVLGDYEDVERDTMRNLRLMDFCRQYAQEESDRYVLEQYRPYILMMCTRARGQMALRDNRPKAALTAVRQGIAQIESFYESFGGEKTRSHSGEIAVLHALEKEIEAQIPADPVQQIRERLAEAVESEQYELAAELRDRLRQMTER